jgi:hypothetical protein
LLFDADFNAPATALRALERGFLTFSTVFNASTFGDIGYTATDDPKMVQRFTVIPVEPDVVDNSTVRETLCGPHAQEWEESIHN